MKNSNKNLIEALPVVVSDFVRVQVVSQVQIWFISYFYFIIYLLLIRLEHKVHIHENEFNFSKTMLDNTAPFNASSILATSSASSSCSGNTGTIHRGCDIFSSKAFSLSSGKAIWKIITHSKLIPRGELMLTYYYQKQNYVVNYYGSY